MKVLISDDDQTSRLLMRSLLQTKLGYEVLETTDGLKAWETLNSGTTVDLCIVDMWMPKMSGLDLISKLRSDLRFQHQKVVLCSAENERSAIMKAVSLGIDGYLIKPFAAEQFLNKVRQACETGESLRRDGALEPIEAVLVRLGIERKAYLELFEVFTKDVAGLIASLREPRGKMPKGEMQMRLSGLRGAGCSLGAAALVEAIRRLEKIGPEKEFSAIRSFVESIQVENERVIAVMAVLASRDAPSEKKPQQQNLKAGPA